MTRDMTRGEQEEERAHAHNLPPRCRRLYAASTPSLRLEAGSMPALRLLDRRSVRPIVDDLIVSTAQEVIDAKPPGVVGPSIHREQLGQLARTLDVAAHAELHPYELDARLALEADLLELAPHHRATINLVRWNDRDQPTRDRKQEQTHDREQ